MSELGRIEHRRLELNITSDEVTGELILDIFRFFAQNNIDSRRQNSNPLINGFLEYARRGLDWHERTCEGEFKLAIQERKYGVLRNRRVDESASIEVFDGKRQVTGTVAAINADALALILHCENGEEIEAIPIVDPRSLEPTVDIVVLGTPSR